MVVRQACCFVLLGTAFVVAEEPLIQPLELVPAKPKEEQSGGRRVEGFLNDCFDHPALRVPLEISVQSMPLKQVIELLAERAQFSVVVDDAISGVVPLLMVRGEPIGSVLHTLLAGRSPPWGILILNKVLHVAPRSVLVKRARQLLVSRYESPTHAELTVVWIAWTDQLKLKLEAMWQHCTRQYIGSARTQYFFTDDESRRVLIQGTADQVALFKRMLAAIDVSTPQVKIEARIVVARSDFMTKLGLNAQLRYGGGPLSFESVGGIIPTSLPWALKTVASGGNGLELPFLFNSSSSMNALNFVLNAAEGRNLVRTLLAPQIMSCSGKQAVLHEGQSIPIETFTEDSVEGRTRTVRSAQYKDVGVKVQVKPIIFADGQRVKIDVLVENSHLSSRSNSTNYPTIATARLHNTIILKSGQTVLLGGLTQAAHASEESGLPWIYRVPIIGRLFSGSARNRQDCRLYVFLQATILGH